MTWAREYVLWLLEPERRWERVGGCSAISIHAEVENVLAGSPPGSRVWALPSEHTPESIGDMLDAEWIVGPDGRPVHQPISTIPQVDVVPGPDGYRWRAWSHDVEADGRTRDEAVQRWHEAANVPGAPAGNPIAR